MTYEIERKWILKRPKSEWYSSSDYLCSKIRTDIICQYYITPNARVRRTNGDHTLTIKSGEGLVRSEVEFDILAKDYTQVSKMGLPQIIKYRTEFHGRMFLDQFVKAELSSSFLYILEVEFVSTSDAEVFELPELFKDLVITEVTNDPEWSNYSLAKNGMPKGTLLNEIG